MFFKTAKGFIVSTQNDGVKFGRLFFILQVNVHCASIDGNGIFDIKNIKGCIASIAVNGALSHSCGVSLAI